MLKLISPFGFELKKLKLINIDEDTFTYIWFQNHEAVLIRKYDDYRTTFDRSDAMFQNMYNPMDWNDFCELMYQHMRFFQIENNQN